MADENTPYPYRLKDVKIGDELVRGRPVEWDREATTGDGKDESDAFVEPLIYEATCPNCGQLVTYDAKFASVVCENCGAGEFKLDVYVNNPVQTLDVDELLADEKEQPEPEAPLNIPPSQKPVEVPEEPIDEDEHNMERIGFREDQEDREINIEDLIR